MEWRPAVEEHPMSGEPPPEHGITVLQGPPSPRELLARGRRLREELRAWIAELGRLPSPDPDRTFCEVQPGWLLLFLREQMRSILEGE
jgi:hypothetical protein